MDRGKVSFIIVNWNGRETVEECLDSLLGQTHTNREIIFVDNHSSDGSLELVRDSYSLDKLISLDQNHGYAEANNIGFAQAEGKFIALVNNDAVLDPLWLENAVNVFCQDKEGTVGSVATKIINYHQRDIIDTAGVEFFGFGAGWDYKGLPVDSKEVNSRKEVFGAVATASLYRKKILDRIGLFDPRYFIYFEDTDLAFKLRLFGYKCLYEPEAICFHHGGVKQDKDSRFYIDYGRRNIEFLFLKNFQGRLLAKYALSHCLYEGVLFGFFLFSGKGIPFLRAKIQFLKNLGYLLQERKKLKQALKISGKYEDAHLIERHFFRSTWRGLSDKVRKALSAYKAYMNLG
jgi:GT2 family glycosyltransferase